MRKAVAPMMGGVNIPPVEATASTAPASSAGNPVFFIMGMVICPVVATLAATEPEREPKNMLESTAVLAGPPRYAPRQALARSLKKSLAPVTVRMQPKRMKPGTVEATVPTMLPQ